MNPIVQGTIAGIDFRLDAQDLAMLSEPAIRATLWALFAAAREHSQPRLPLDLPLTPQNQESVARLTEGQRVLCERNSSGRVPEIGPALARVRDYLCRSPGQPPDPEFERVVRKLGWAKAQAIAEQDSRQSPDVAWKWLRVAADVEEKQAEKQEC